MKPKQTVINAHGDSVVRTEHPAMGVVVVNRCSSVGTNLFGSEIAHQHFIKVAVKRASLDRHLNRDRVRGGETIVEFALSSAQWAQMVSSVGMAEGTRVTLMEAPEIGTPIHSVPKIDREPMRDTFDKEVSQAIQSANEDVLRVQGMLREFLKPGAKKPGKADMETMYNALLQAGKHFQSNMEFILESFRESMEEVTESAKSEVEMFVSGVAQRAGLDALRNGGMPALGHDDTESVE